MLIGCGGGVALGSGLGTVVLNTAVLYTAEDVGVAGMVLAAKVLGTAVLNTAVLNIAVLNTAEGDGKMAGAAVQADSANSRNDPRR